MNESARAAATTRFAPIATEILVTSVVALDASPDAWRGVLLASILVFFAGVAVGLLISTF